MQRIAKDWTNHGLARLERELHDWKIVPDGTEGYAKAEVTAGGVDTNEFPRKPWSAEKSRDCSSLAKL